MPAPVFFITTHKIKPGQFQAFKELNDEYLKLAEEQEPRAWAHYTYLDEDACEVTLVQVHPDAESADHHMQVAGEQIGRGLELTETTDAIVYGAPGPVVRAALQHNVDAGVAVNVKATALGGFHRAPTHE